MRSLMRLLVLFLCLLPALAWAASTSGPQRILALSVRFADQPKGGYALDRVRAAVEDAGKIIKWSSGGKWWIEKLDVEFAVTTLTSKSGCQIVKWKNDGIAALGLKESDYDHIVVIGGSGCVRGSANLVKMAYSYQPAAMHIVHEMGHNFGFGHSPTSDGGEYGNSSNAMGGSYAVPFGSFHRYQVKWLDEPQVVSTMGGRHTLAPLNGYDDKLQVIRLHGSEQWPHQQYAFVEYREPIGEDARLAPEYHNRVLVHSYYGGKWVRRAVLGEGQYYYDSARNIFVRVNSIKPGAADVEAYANKQKCVSTAPTLTAGQVPAVAGPVEWDVTIRNNNDPTTCVPARLQVTGTGGAVPAVNAVFLASGESTTIRASATLTEGKHELSIRAGLTSSGVTWDRNRQFVMAKAPEPDPNPEPDTKPPPVQPGSATIIAAADTYFSVPHAKSSFGNAASLLSKKPYYIPAFRFTVFESDGGPVPDGATIIKATLRLYKTSAYDHVYRLHPMRAPWAENVTMNASPGYADKHAAEASTAWASGWLEFDVTGSLRDAPHGWALVPVSGNPNIKRFASREDTDEALRPRLEVSWR